MDQASQTSRRKFLALAGMGGSAMLLGRNSLASPNVAADSSATKASEISNTSEPFRFSCDPLLQMPLDRSLAVRWITNRPSKTWVEYGTTEKLGQISLAERHGLVDLTSNKQEAILDDLEPGKNYFYRVVAKEFLKSKGYDVTYGEEISTPIKPFKALDPKRETVAFSMLNDTHQKYDVVEQLLSDPKRPEADWIFLAGDALEPSSDTQVQRELLSPLSRLIPSTSPLIFVRGNHDTRGSYAAHLSEYFTLPEGRFYFHFRQGPIHFTVLDTGEDKSDDHQYLRGLTAFSGYLKRQERWLRETVFTSESFRTASFRIVVCHMPVHRGRIDFPLPWMKSWSELFDEVSIDLMLSGHNHDNAYEKPGEGHRYHLLIGGGPNENRATRTDIQATATTIRLSQTRPNGQSVGQWEIGKRS